MQSLNRTGDNRDRWYRDYWAEENTLGCGWSGDYTGDGDTMYDLLALSDGDGGQAHEASAFQRKGDGP